MLPIKKLATLFIAASLASPFALAADDALLAANAALTSSANVPETKAPEDQSIALDAHLRIIAIQKHMEDAELAYQVDVNYPRIEGQDLSAAALAFNQKVQSMVDQAVEQFIYYVKKDHVHMQTLPESVQHNVFQIDYDLEVVKPANHPIISVRLRIEGMQAGRAHPYHVHQVLNFDLINNKVLTLDDLFKTHSNYLTVIAKFCNHKLTSTLKDKWMIADGTAPTPANYKNWNIENDGILITFDEYQVAPYVYGAQEIEIPYATLKPVLAADSPLSPCLKGDYHCIAGE